MEIYSYTITTKKGQLLDTGTVMGTEQEAIKAAEELAKKEPMCKQVAYNIKVMKIK